MAKRRLKQIRHLARRNAKVKRYQDARGRFITEERYRELKAREKDAAFKRFLDLQTKRTELEKRAAAKSAANRASVASSKRQGKRRKRRLKRAGVEPQGGTRPTLVDYGTDYKKSIYVWGPMSPGDVSSVLEDAKDFVRGLWGEEPTPRVRVTIRAGDGRGADSIGSLWEAPRAASLYLGGVEHRQSAKILLEHAEDRELPVYIEVEVLRARSTRMEAQANASKRQRKHGKSVSGGPRQTRKRVVGGGVRKVQGKRAQPKPRLLRQSKGKSRAPVRGVQRTGKAKRKR